VAVAELAFPKQNVSFAYLLYQDSPLEEESTQQIRIALALCTRIQWMPAYNVGQDMGYTDWGSSKFFLSPRDKF
jgi:hypothetical protein